MTVSTAVALMLVGTVVLHWLHHETIRAKALMRMREAVERKAYLARLARHTPHRPEGSQ